MNEDDKLDIFNAQTINVRYLEKVWKHLKREINNAYLADNKILIDINTKLLIQVYCSYAESIFSKTLHTPYGLELDEIEQIKKIADKKGITNGWKKCFEIAITKIDGSSGSHKPNIKQKFNRLVDSYLFEPHLLRNKIAHGQWIEALNSKNTKTNSDVSSQLELITILDLDRFKEALKSIYTILEDIIESPNKAHRKFYWEQITEFEVSQIKMAKWNIENKIETLKKKKSYFKKSYDAYFASKIDKYIFALTKLDGTNRQKILAITPLHYQNKEVANKWKKEIDSLINPKKCSHLKAKEAWEIMNNIYSEMVSE